MELINKVVANFIDAVNVKRQASIELPPLIVSAANVLRGVLTSGNKILVCGNGGSAADSQHFAAELTGWFKNRNRRPLPVIALTTDTSAITAIANDSDFSQVFVRQINALGNIGDALVVISTSGKSPNIIHAIEAAQQKGMFIIALTGQNGLSCPPLTHNGVVVLPVSSTETSRIQEVHIFILHTLCDLLEDL